LAWILTGTIALLWITGSAYHFVTYVKPQWSKLRVAGSGKVDAAALSMAKWADLHIPAGEKVVLPGVIFSSGRERWLQTQGIAKGLAHFSGVETCFFHAPELPRTSSARAKEILDNQPCSLKSYEAHVQNTLDLDWLRKHRMVWIVGSPFLPQIHFEHYDLKWSSGPEASLWRMKEQ